MPVSAAASFVQIAAPVRASTALASPVPPSVYTRPRANVGVPRGPAPALDSQNRARSAWRQIGWPVFRL